MTARDHLHRLSHHSPIASAILMVLCIFTIALPADAQVRHHGARRSEGGMGLDLKWYCQQRWGAASSAVNVDQTANGWRCTNGHRLVELSANAACRLHYGNTAVERVAPRRRAGDLYCVLGLNLDAYCRSIHGASSQATRLTPSDPHSWMCRRGRDLLDIRIREACRHHYGPKATPVLGRHDDPKAWTCEIG